jgi:ribosomal protein L7/L12
VVAFGLAELTILGALIIGAFILIGVVRAFMFQAQTSAVEPNFKAKTKPIDIDWNALADAELQSHLPHMKINAIKRYRELTGAGLKESMEAVEYAMAHPEQMGQKGKSGGTVVDTEGAGVRDLIAEGRIDEAVKVYAAFMGVDEFTARAAVAQMQREDSAVGRLSDENMDEIRAALQDGNKIVAIKLYREYSGLGLKEAKDIVDQMERDGF